MKGNMWIMGDELSSTKINEWRRNNVTMKYIIFMAICEKAENINIIWKNMSKTTIWTKIDDRQQWKYNEEISMKEERSIKQGRKYGQYNMTWNMKEDASEIMWA